jgi:hypothetical protein
MLKTMNVPTSKLEIHNAINCLFIDLTSNYIS